MDRYGFLLLIIAINSFSEVKAQMKFSLLPAEDLQVNFINSDDSSYTEFKKNGNRLFRLSCYEQAIAMYSLGLKSKPGDK